MSFYTSLTGLNSATSQLAVSSNNIANVGTTAFKRSRADFGDIFSTSPLQKASSQIGQGVLIKGVTQEFSQGNISTSGNSLDLAVTGDGFFKMKSLDGLQDIYTRNGAFMLNEQNYVVNSQGMRLMAASVDSSGKADLNNLNVLSIPSKTSGDAISTSNMELAINLPQDSKAITVPFDRTDPSTFNESTAMTVYDASGTGYLATVYYQKTQDSTASNPYNKWQTYYFIGDESFQPELQQAVDTNGKSLWMNMYGDVDWLDKRPNSAMSYPEYRYDANLNAKNSTPASVISGEVDLTKINGTEITFNLTVDGLTKEIVFNSNQADFQTAEKAAAALEKKINETFAADPNDARYGMSVTYSGDGFVISSGSTGDASSIAIGEVAALGFASAITVDASDSPLRGKSSSPAILTTEQVSLSSAGTLNLSLPTTFSVSSDGVSGYFELKSDDIGGGDIDPLIVAEVLQEKISGDLYSSSALEGDPVDGAIYGVNVSYDDEFKKFVFSTSTTGDTASIDIRPVDTVSAEIMGLAENTSAYGETSSWVAINQHAENNADQYVNFSGGYYDESSDGSGTIPSFGALGTSDEYAVPVLLDPGELTFDSLGNLISPVSGAMRFTTQSSVSTAFTSMDVDLTNASQYGASFSVLSQYQNGAPEGDLMGLEIGDDGLVSANFSNGTQKSLGKIVLANFASPSGLRQMGDARYLASTASGEAKVGEAGSSGFGSIRAGAIERSNVDLTQELVDLITAQRNFQANAKAIETSNTLTQAIINIRG